MRLDIKPLSVNEAWQGRRYKTPKYNKYINDVLIQLRPLKVDSGALVVNLKFGLSSKSADVDNPVKCFIDCLQKKYNFNDKNIYKLIVEKVDVKKGCEFIEFKINSLS